MKRIGLLLLLVVLAPDSSRSQTSLITGQVLMLDKETPHASLVMQAIEGTLVLQTVLTDDEGNFQFTFDKPISFRIRIHSLKEYMYYHKDQNYTISYADGSVIQVDSNSDLSLGHIFLPRIIKGKIKQYHPVDGLADAYCTSILRDQRGQMWIGTEGGFSFFENGQLTSVNMVNGLPNNWVRCMLAINEKEMLVGTRSGLVQFNWQTKDLKKNKNKELSGKNVAALIKNQDGDILIGADDTVHSLDSKNQIRKIFSLTEGIIPTKKEPPVPLFISGIIEDKNKTLWILTRENAYTDSPSDIGRVFRYKDNSVSKWKLLGNEMLNPRVYQMEISAEDERWLATNQGLIKIEKNGNYKRYTTKDGLFLDEVNLVYKSFDNSIWIGYASRGKNVISRLNADRIVHFIKLNNYARAISPSIDGKMWIATAGNGLWVYDDKSMISYEPTDLFPYGTVPIIKSGYQNKVWVLLGQRWPSTVQTVPAIYSIDQETDQVQKLELPKKLEPVNIELDAQENLLILSNQGVFKYDGQQIKQLTEKVFSSVTLSQDQKIWLHSNEENHLYTFGKKQMLVPKEEAKINSQSWLMLVENNNFWFGSFNYGLSRLSNKLISNFTVKDGFGSERAWCALPTKNQGIWFGTWRISDGVGGISVYKEGKFSSVTKSDGLSQDIVFDISEDNSGRIWIATWGGGVSLYDGVSWSTIDINDGLNSGYIMSVNADNFGNVWIGSKNGLFRYHVSQTRPKVFVKKAIISDSIYTYPTKEINVKIGQRITIINESIDYNTNSNRIQYRHRLLQNGVGDWNSSTNDSSYNFTPRKEGKYEFEVTSIDRDLNYSEPQKITFDVSQYWHLKKSFIYPVCVLATTILLTGTFFGVKYYQSKIESNRLAFEAQQLREKIISDLTQELDEAKGMQMALLPQHSPNIRGLEISGRNIGAKEVGGDFFNYLTSDANQVTIALGDVSGKGLKGAMNAVMASGILNLSAEYQTSPSNIMSDMNNTLCQNMEQDMNVTMILAQFDMQNNKMILANAGQHAYPIVKRGSSLETVKAKGLALGMIPSIPYKPIIIDLQSGDLLLFMTDGITEPRNAEGLMYEESGRFHQVISQLSDDLTAEEVVESIIQDVIDYMVDEEERDDDITLVAVKVT